MKPTPKKSPPLTQADLQRLCTGRLTIRKLQRFHPKLRKFTTYYVPTIRGVLLKTKQGLRFASAERAKQAGKATMARLRKTYPS